MSSKTNKRKKYPYLYPFNLKEKIKTWAKEKEEATKTSFGKDPSSEASSSKKYRKSKENPQTHATLKEVFPNHLIDNIKPKLHAKIHYTKNKKK